MSCGDNPASGLQDSRWCSCNRKRERERAESICPLSSSTSFCPVVASGRKMASVDSHKNLGKCVCAGAGDEGLGRVEGHVVNGLVVLLPVGSDFLHTRPVVQHPKTHRAVVASRDEVSAFRVCSEACDCIQVSHHRVDYFASLVVHETDGAVLVCSNGDRFSWMTDDAVD